MNVKTVNDSYLTFVVTQKDGHDVLESCYENENKASNVLKHLYNIPNMKCCVAHSNGIFYSSCMSI